MTVVRIRKKNVPQVRQSGVAIQLELSAKVSH